MSNKVTVTFQMPESLKKKAARKAKKEGYSLAHYVRIAIQEKIDGER